MFNRNSGARSQNEKIKIKIIRGIFQSNSGFRLPTPEFFTGYLGYPVNITPLPKDRDDYQMY